MKTDIDYRLPENRQIGFENYFEAACFTNESEVDTYLLKAFADQEGWDFEGKCSLAFMYGLCYCGPTALLMASKFPKLTRESVLDFSHFLSENKQRIYFSTDCRWNKIHSDKLLLSVSNSLEDKSLGEYLLNKLSKLSPHESFSRIWKECMNDWWHWNRGSHWIFTEGLNDIAEIPLDPGKLFFGKEGESHTNGALIWSNQESYLSDVNSWTPRFLDNLENKARIFLEDFKKKHRRLNNANFFTLETAFCNIKRQFKGTRYALCYIDGQYDEALKVAEKFPEYQWIFKTFIDLRKKIFEPSLLFENHRNTAKTDHAYIDCLTKALSEHGRMPRVEAWFNNQPQIWDENLYSITNEIPSEFWN